MPFRWIKRRAHERRLPTGGSTHVLDSWEFRPSKDGKDKAYRHPCPICGAQIITMRMPNGGWAHFEGGKDLSKIKHPCSTIGEGLSKARDSETTDLFAAENHQGKHGNLSDNL